ncbi:MAG: type II toxin-antitoxin system RelE/ParE family toxin [Bacteroidales bacterium]|nr:type II toxin-antitoxin system RelE/ParE family toxin [Bacteroidales bacterium]
MKKEYVRKVVVYGDYFKEFRKTLNKETLKKLYQVLTLIMKVEIVPEKFLKAVKGYNGLYEVRLEYEGNIYRIFCCFDEGDLVILFNGFQKKTQKTPVEQLAKAAALMKMYYEQKKKSDNGQ